MSSSGHFSDTNAVVDTAEASFSKYQGGHHGDKLLNKAEDSLSAIQKDAAEIKDYVSPLQGVLDTEPVEAIRQSITAFVDGLPVLLKVLDDVAQIHPFIKIAVGAFRVAVELDLKRRDNDTRIPILFVEMRDMMSVLVQLQNIDKGKCAGDGGETIEIRMQHLVKKTEDDIRQCANACNAYSKKRTICKVLQSSSWEETFQAYVKCFTIRRGEFEFALSLFIGRAVNTANDMLVILEEKMDRRLQYFKACASPEERDIKGAMSQLEVGPEGVMNDEKLLRQLYYKRPRTDIGMLGSANRSQELADEFMALQLELKVDSQTAIRDNLEQFKQIFLVQSRELEEGLRRAMHREGDRIIESVTSGPHDDIIDPDIYAIWKQMRWGVNVEARQFVLALRDHFREKLKRAKTRTTPTVASSHFSEQDEWTFLECFNGNGIRSIMEAIDYDASGSITVTKVNAFTTARPDDWRLLHWLAYWAVGYHLVLCIDAARINVLLEKMFSIKSQVLAANRTSVEEYLHVVWTSVARLTSGLLFVSMDHAMYGKMQSYIESEEDRLRRDLVTVKYKLHAADAVELVLGRGRTEQHILPVLYLLLHRDFEVMRLARKHVLHIDELFDGRQTVTCVLYAIGARCKDLAEAFQQRKLDPGQEFKIFGFGIFNYVCDASTFYSMKNIRKAKFIDCGYDDSAEAQDVNVTPASILNHPLQTPEDLFTDHQFVETEDDRRADPHIKAIIGHWSCFFAIGSFFPCHWMINLDIHASSDPKEFQSSGINPNGTNWTVNGKYSVDDNDNVHYEFTRTYTARFSTQYFRGNLQPNESTFSGIWAHREDFADAANANYTFVCKRLCPSLMCFWPSPTELAKNKACALWKFAISATVADVRRRLCSWSFLKERWEIGRRFFELLDRLDMPPHLLTRKDMMEIARIQRSMTSGEARFHFRLGVLRRRSIPIHYHIVCNACEKIIHGTRVTCMTCGKETTMDICDKAQCLSREFNLVVREEDHSPHLPSHDVFKLRTTVHQIREYGLAHRAALKALEMAQTALSNAADLEKAATQDVKGVSTERGEPTALTTTTGIYNQLRCVKCSVQVSRPCWYCIECEGHVFICFACDEKHGGVSCGKHKATHGLVRCQPPGPSSADSERAQLNTRFGTLENNLSARLQEHFASVKGRPELETRRVKEWAIAFFVGVVVSVIYMQFTGRVA